MAHVTLNRAFQRLALYPNYEPGALPQAWIDIAPLALRFLPTGTSSVSVCIKRQRRAFIFSLGQRPKDFRTTSNTSAESAIQSRKAAQHSPLDE
jgi:hypothetical protein